MSQLGSSPVGSAVCAVIILGAAYELVALNSSLPTISRIVQGWRDDGALLPYGAALAGSLAALVGFTAWLFRHFTRDKRSRL